MSTDDLTRRARAEVRTLDAGTNGQANYTQELITALADEVDRLRESALDSRLNIEGLEVELHEAKTERDAARAALERVRVALDANSGRKDMNLGVRLPMLTGEIRRALEGES